MKSALAGYSGAAFRINKSTLMILAKSVERHYGLLNATAEMGSVDRLMSSTIQVCYTHACVCVRVCVAST